MAKKPKDEEPTEICVFCEQDVPCCWTVIVGRCEYALCKECPPEAEKDGFKYRLRTELDRNRAKGEVEGEQE